MTPRAAPPLARAHRNLRIGHIFVDSVQWLRGQGYHLVDDPDGGVWLSSRLGSVWFPGWHPAYLSVASGDGALARLARGER